MQVKQLFADRYVIVGTMERGICDAEIFLTDGEVATLAWREGLGIFLAHIAENGLQNVSNKLVREVSKKEKIYEFRKGDLRLFFFHGEGNCIAVCCSGVIKKGQKADISAVTKAARLRSEYMSAVANQTIEVIKDDHK